MSPENEFEIENSKNSSINNKIDKKERDTGIKVWLSDLSHRAFILTVISGVFSGIIAWFIQDYISERGKKNTDVKLFTAIQGSVTEECKRLQQVFENFYDNYPTITCQINVYRLPQPDVSLVDYLNDRREMIVDKMGQEGPVLIRYSALSSEAYDRIFSDQYFQSTIYEDTSIFHDYFEPIEKMCSIFDMKISLQKCPF